MMQLTPYSVVVFTHDTRRNLARFDRDWLVNNALLLGVVAHFHVTRNGEIFAEWVPDKTIVGKNTTQVGMPFKHNTEQVKRFTLEPVHGGPDINQCGQNRKIVAGHKGAHTHAPIVFN